MKKYIYILCLSVPILCLKTVLADGQALPIDSLKRVLIRLDTQPDGYIKDTLRYRTLKALMQSYSNTNIDSSVHYNTLTIGHCVKHRLQPELVYAYLYAGYLYQVKGDHYQSIQFNYKALSLAERLKLYTRMAQSYGELAHAYNSLKNYTKAIQLCQQGRAILRHHPDAYTQLAILNVLGALYREQKRFFESLKVNNEMYQLARQEHRLWYEAQGMHAIGWVYKEMGDPKKALDYYTKALALARKIGSVDLEGSILLNTTSVYILQRKWAQALTFCQLAKQKALSVKNSSIVAESEEKLYTIFKNTGEPQKALQAYEDFVFLKDSLSKEKTQQRIDALRAEYDNVQKTNALQKQSLKLLAETNRSQALAQSRNVLILATLAILLVASSLFWNNRRLKFKNQEIDHQRTLLEMARTQLADINKNLEARVEMRTEELVKANQALIQKNEEIKKAQFKGQTIERKRVAIELHDNLSSLLSAVNMSIQAINPQNLSDSEQSVYRNVKQLIQNAYSEVRNISHNILPAELEQEGLSATLTTLVGRLNQNSPLQFALTITGLHHRLPIEIEFNVYSIVLELINNAIKHAQATSVSISLLRTDLGINLSVTDDGIGMDQQPSKRGIGLQNIEARLESLGGTFNVLLPTEKGTRIVIKIPVETVRFDGNMTVL
jgi:NarL family two-component system sensor histidine kinase LiaS